MTGLMSFEQRCAALKKHCGWVTLFVIGILAILAPLAAGIAISIATGVLIGVGGVLQVIHAVRAKSWGAGTLRFLGGALSLVCGGLMVARPGVGLAVLTLLLIFYFFMDGISTMALSFHLRPLKGWGWTLFGGIITLVLAVIIWIQWPLSGIWAIGTLVGVNLVFSGNAMLWLGFGARSAADAVQANGPDPAP